MAALGVGGVLTVVGMAVLASILLPVSAYNNGVGRLPPMGWNTWCTEDACGLKDVCSEKLVKSVADAIASNGLKDLGYEYINMDDCWSDTSRNATGHLQPIAKQFPSGMRALADYVHSKGLKLGLYICVGTLTCKHGRPGTYGYWQKDADTIADWGLDFVKADNCHKPGNLTELEAYTNLSQALNATGRPILFSLCEWGTKSGGVPVEQWGGKLGQMYRVQMDHIPFWHTIPSLAGAGAGFGGGTGDIIEYYGTLKPSAVVGPYSWMDPDFLETLFPITMNFVDSRTEYTFWSLWSAPLIVATDVRNMDEQKKSILMNPEVIAIDQDESFTAGDRLYNLSTGAQLWARDLHNGDKAVVLYNADHKTPTNVSVTWHQIGWQEGQRVVVRDLWERKDLGTHQNGFAAASVGPHDVLYLRLKPVSE